MLRTNQAKALRASIENNFASGVHFHATGTGKSWIALELLRAYNERNPTGNIFWICEQKSILIEQFNKDVISSKGYGDILKKFLILDYTTNKESEWASHVNSCSFWKKPILLILNRAFLTSSRKYKSLRIPFHLLIHDECHSISNSTTQDFYRYATAAWPSLSCIGFSATPLLTHAPYTKILSSYTIYDGILDGVILPPKIVWVKSDTPITHDALLTIVKKNVDALPYKKLILWCGMIEACKTEAALWAADPYFASWTIALDTSEDGTHGFDSYESFRNCESHGLLFCASKHREGSDIPFLDGCIFLDRVEDRNAKTFIQCMGRVLRKDPAGAKTYGLVFDICALSSMKICDRIHKFLDTPSTASIFPFSYTMDKQSTHELHSLSITNQTKPTESFPIVQNTADELVKHFIRPIPEDPHYRNRLRMELEMIAEKKLNGYLLQAVAILEITKNIPHVTRGSCGSSLVCYLLGISHIDPIAWNINFARFLNEFRSNLPDIDFDFPHNIRDEVFLQIQMKWPGKIARISNHVYFHDKSALREAVRRAGVRRMIPALEIRRYVSKMPAQQRNFVYEEKKKLENTFRNYSLHCGGIVFYPDGVPEVLKLRSKTSPVMAQVMLNKHDIAKDKNFKIDILSSRALTQLYEAYDFKEIPFTECMHDEATIRLLQAGDNIGLTLAESPLIRKSFLKIQPSCLEHVAQCLAIIRPAARDARFAERSDDLDAYFVYDDDAITMIMEAVGCSAAEADRYRRAVAKGNRPAIKELKEKLGQKHEIFAALRNLRKYSFCKSHAFSYAQLVWQLAYMKANHPQAFWKATLKHCESSYRKWVHFYEAQQAGVDVHNTQGKHKSIYAQARAKKKDINTMTPLQQLHSFGYWKLDGTRSFYPNCYLRTKHTEAEATADTEREDTKPNGEDTKPTAQIRGLIANSRFISYSASKRKAVVFIGYDTKKYVEVIITGKTFSLQKKVGITCAATQVEEGVYETDQSRVEFW